MSTRQPDLLIHTLRDRPDLLDTASGWIWDTWVRTSENMTLDAHTAWMTASYVDRPAQAPDAWEMCWVATSGDAPVGTASLVRDDGLPAPWTATHPWLASVFVPPASRGHRIASSLVSHVEDAARAAGHPRIHLYTPDQQSLYRRHGFRKIDTSQAHGVSVDVMAKDPT